MPSNIFNPTERDPGPFAPGRRCAHFADDGERCITRLHRNHAGHYCYAHEAAHLDEPAENATLAPERELVAA